MFYSLTLVFLTKTNLVKCENKIIQHFLFVFTKKGGHVSSQTKQFYRPFFFATIAWLY